MKYGTRVIVRRGSMGRIPTGERGCGRDVKGVLIGSRGNEMIVRLSEDDLLDTVGWSMAGDVGRWSKSAVSADESEG